MNLEHLSKYKNTRQLICAMAAYSGTSILGPLLLIGGVGYFLDKMFNTNPILLIVSVIIAFIVTNILLYKKVKVLINKVKS
ncbi:AtpZ/AtpI family protein [Patescibacteria group bacterium]|nr:AtpZ/AtpI family protein [Patescibacteria group bacterium]MBU1663478.1 AtpZ/AtpI family protein [Patescibacteria group bacterium]MBU1933723.1 AtpZ/AtpI family protein [Patescibacteria group bacterium]MBU2007669.1 AtpZ/AtpI family protein [Patescibacteria group bacterium]MBU2233611.1 AtpZ/AtpI family protein [Patescibacteria group bacterium]